MDLTKAFDNVQLPDVIEVLEEEQIPLEVVKIIQCLNTNIITAVQVNNQTSKSILTPGGI